jgi:alkanesulfonate monooxygenase SsuD/methylene tetrahydromethanopterin reductase-like flavin-dependent oxidoreductase (luciferase family)
MEFNLRYDLNSPPFGASQAALYRAAIDQAVWADRLGFSQVYLAEHHGAEHGYCPSPMVLAGAVLGATANIHVHLSALVITLHHPLRLAEDLAVLDIMSNGRVCLTAGMGYRPHEFEMFGLDITKRLAILNDTLAVLKKAWTGEPFEYNGRQVRVTPPPVTPGGPKIYMGGSTEKSAIRAGKQGYQYRPGHPALFEIYKEERAKAGYPPPEPLLKSAANFLYVTEDPDRDWPLLAPHLRFATNTYAEWAKERGVGSTTYKPAVSDEELRTLDIFKVLRPDECYAYLKQLGQGTQVTFHAMFGGIDPAFAWKGLHLFEEKVLPRLVADGLAPKPRS